MHRAAWLGWAELDKPAAMPQCLQGLQHAPGRMTDAGMAAHQASIDFYDTAELYYAYHLIYTTASQPFKTVDDATLFNAARYPIIQHLVM